MKIKYDYLLIGLLFAFMKAVWAGTYQLYGEINSLYDGLIWLGLASFIDAGKYTFFLFGVWPVLIDLYQRLPKRMDQQ